MIVVQRFYKLQVPLCRRHGQLLAAKWLLWTLVQGWWGYISFFVNVFDIGTDVIALVRFSRLSPHQTQSSTSPLVSLRRPESINGVESSRDASTVNSPLPSPSTLLTAIAALVLPAIAVLSIAFFAKKGLLP
jgi:hypothetical protein